jgi:hypothetical protein
VTTISIYTTIWFQFLALKERHPTTRRDAPGSQAASPQALQGHNKEYFALAGLYSTALFS